MLSILRKKHVAKWGLIILTTVIIFAFVFWGSSSILRERGGQAPLGRIFGRPVSTEDYREALLAVRNLALMRFGDKFSEVADYLDLETQAWERLILLEEARRRRIKVSDQQLIARIREFPFFRQNGVFNATLYEQLTSYAFQTPARVFEEQTRQTLAIATLYEEVTRSVVSSDEELRQEYEKQNMQIRVAYIAAFPSAFADALTPNEAELEDYYNKNSVSFKEPLSLKIAYVSAPAKDRIEHAYEKIRKSTPDMKSLAAELELTFKETEFFAENDPIPGIGWDRRLNKLLTEAPEGGVIPPFSDHDKTYYLAQVTARREPVIPAFEAVKEKVKADFIQAESVARASKRIEEAYDELRQQAPQERSLQRTAQKFGLTYDVSDPFNFQSYIEGIGSSNPFWLAARAIEKPEMSTVLNTPSGFFILWPEEKIPIDEEAYEKDKEAFRQEVLSRKKEERFAVFMRSLSQAALQ